MTPQVIGELVLSPSFDMATAVAQVTPEALAGAIERYEAAQRPMADAEPHYLDPAKRSPRMTEISRGLQLIGGKVAPNMGAEPATLWRDAILVSLSDYPVNAVRSAVNAAVKEPFKFLSDVDPRLHVLAAEAVERARGALLRLKRMRDEIERAMNPPQPMLEAPAEPVSDAMLAQLATGEIGKTVLRLGLTAGHVTRAQYDEAMRAAPPENEGLASHETEGYMAGTEGNPEQNNADAGDQQPDAALA